MNCPKCNYESVRNPCKKCGWDVWEKTYINPQQKLEKQDVQKEKNKGFVENCTLMVSKKDRAKRRCLFMVDNDGIITPQLDGYAIIPIELFNKIEKENNHIIKDYYRDIMSHGGRNGVFNKTKNNCI